MLCLQGRRPPRLARRPQQTPRRGRRPPRRTGRSGALHYRRRRRHAGRRGSETAQGSSPARRPRRGRRECSSVEQPNREGDGDDGGVASGSLTSSVSSPASSGANGEMRNRKFTSATYIPQALVPVRTMNRYQCLLWFRLVLPTGTKGLFSAAQRAANRDLWFRLVALTGTKGGHWSRLVLRTGNNATLSFRLVPPTGTKGLAPRCGGMFSPTSLVEGWRERFISTAAPTLSSSSQLQASGPTLSLFARGPTGPSAGLNPGPLLGF